MSPSKIKIFVSKAINKFKLNLMQAFNEIRISYKIIIRTLVKFTALYFCRIILLITPSKTLPFYPSKLRISRRRNESTTLIVAKKIAPNIIQVQNDICFYSNSHEKS